jgi:ATP-dependent Clp protease protease subunit
MYKNQVFMIKQMQFGDFRKFALSRTRASGTAVDKLITRLPKNYLMPYIMEERDLHVTQMDVFSRMMFDRVIFLGTPIDSDVANVIQAQLLYLESADTKKNIQLYINSPGGGVYAGLGIYDTMQFVEPTVSTICIGLCASMAAILLAAGTKGDRGALKHARILIHQPNSQAEGQESDIQIVAREIAGIKQELYDILADHTGQTKKRIEKDADRDYWMKAEDAKDYGIIDKVLTKEKN